MPVRTPPAPTRFDPTVVASIVVVRGLGILVAIKGPHEPKLTLQRVGVGVMHVYTRLVAAPDFKNHTHR